MTRSADTDRSAAHVADDLVTVFAVIRLPAPRAIPLLAVEDQIAQKLHACGAPGSDRAHDLVDLQLLVNAAPSDLTKVKALCRCLFASRHTHERSPAVTAEAGWRELYAAATEGLPVLHGVDEAVAWCDQLIADIDVTG